MISVNKIKIPSLEILKVNIESARRIHRLVDSVHTVVHTAKQKETVDTQLLNHNILVSYLSSSQ